MAINKEGGNSYIGETFFNTIKINLILQNFEGMEHLVILSINKFL